MGIRSIHKDSPEKMDECSTKVTAGPSATDSWDLDAYKSPAGKRRMIIT